MSKKTAHVKAVILPRFQTFNDIVLYLQENLPLVLLLSFIVLALYSLSFWNGFITGDDYTGFLQNPAVLSFTAALRTFNFQTIYWASMHNLVGPSAFPLHLTSVFLHALVVFLIFIFVSVFINRPVAFLSAFLFAIHPLNSEAVLWISGVMYLYMAVAGLLVFIFYLLFLNSRKYFYLIISVGVYVAALLFLQNPWLLFFPGYLLLIHMFYGAGGSKLYFSLAPFFACAFLFLLVFMSTRGGEVSVRVNSLNNVESTPILNRAPYTIYMSLKLYTFPFGLTLLHEGENISANMYAFMVFVSLVYVCATIYLLKSAKLRKYGYLICLFSLGWLFSLSPFTIAWFVAERYLYFGNIFFVIFSSVILFNLYKNTQIWFYILITPFVAIYVVLTFLRVGEWSNSLSLWQSTSKVSVNSYRVYNNLGDAYFSKGDLPNSIQNFSRAIELFPNYADAYHNRGNTYLYQGDYAKATLDFNKAVEINPNLYQSYYKLGVAAYKQQNISQARIYFQKALEINPADAASAQALKELN